jgi:hypothetical protein
VKRVTEVADQHARPNLAEAKAVALTDLTETTVRTVLGPHFSGKSVDLKDQT